MSGIAEQLVALAPVFAGVLAGHLLVRSGAATRDQGRFLFLLAFYICVPALVFDAFSTVELTAGIAAMPAAAALAVSGGYLAGRVIGRLLGLEAQRLTVFLLACMIVNTGFTLPFVQAVHGSAGVTRLLAFDAVSATLVFTWSYTLAVRANPAREDSRIPWRKVATNPPLYGIAGGLIVNLAGVEIAPGAAEVVSTLAAPTTFLFTVAIGMVLEVSSGQLRVGAASIATRSAVTAVIAAAFVLLFDLGGLERAVLFALAVAPVGFNTVTFASLEDLDVGLAVSASSLSMAASLVLVPTVLILTA
jgi:hypothetical protein